MEERKEREIRNSQIVLDLIKEKLLENGYEAKKMNKTVFPCAQEQVYFEKNGIYTKIEMYTFED
ncbi:hypothetical protein LCGC14_1151450 [marine sediment metagenome]|uniref:Uncharacterized protein n=1 Tax=marine sediment metagenome TaxID=412755 RepID=A0A0F9PDI3_9ZZZZ